ncbi:MAG: hypothetical protein E6H78_02550 [Betaproteobacteria bacterium]|nr:MAG: hypothetical protein E6H78_02550 [Betaproteobacteria bacterium]
MEHCLEPRRRASRVALAEPAELGEHTGMHRQRVVGGKSDEPALDGLGVGQRVLDGLAESEHLGVAPQPARCLQRTDRHPRSDRAKTADCAGSPCSESEMMGQSSRRGNKNRRMARASDELRLDLPQMRQAETDKGFLYTCGTQNRKGTSWAS